MTLEIQSNFLNIVVRKLIKYIIVYSRKINNNGARELRK